MSGCPPAQGAYALPPRSCPLVQVRTFVEAPAGSDVEKGIVLVLLVLRLTTCSQQPPHTAAPHYGRNVFKPAASSNPTRQTTKSTSCRATPRKKCSPHLAHEMAISLYVVQSDQRRIVRPEPRLVSLYERPQEFSGAPWSWPVPVRLSFASISTTTAQAVLCWSGNTRSKNAQQLRSLVVILCYFSLRRN